MLGFLEEVKDGEERENLTQLSQLNATVSRMQKFETILSQQNVDLPELCKLSWNGIPDLYRPISWQFLLGYLPLNHERRAATLERKRKEYEEIVKESFGGNIDEAIHHQISIDVPRTQPLSPLFKEEIVRKSLLRILYCWAIRHPASSYVQGINDLATPFYAVFLSQYCTNSRNSLVLESKYENFDLSNVTEEQIFIVEADTFWCLTKLLDGIQV